MGVKHGERFLSESWGKIIDRLVEIGHAAAEHHNVGVERVDDHGEPAGNSIDIPTIPVGQPIVVRIRVTISAGPTGRRATGRDWMSMESRAKDQPETQRSRDPDLPQ